MCLFFIFSGQLFAQLCQGSLGDPVVDITFGSGSNPGPPLGNTTNYTYIADVCPNDGYYTIAHSTSNCFGNSWYSVPHDHTGDPNGYMMIVNASYQPGDFFVKQVDGLCPNTTYEFASWIFSLLTTSACQGAGIKPNITFKIETTTGTVLKSYSTDDISSTGDWKQYGFFFTTSVGNGSVVLRMTNNAPGGCGNDVMLDDITFRPCGPLVLADINGSKDSVDVCTGDNSIFTLHADVSAGYSDPVYQWQLSTDSGTSYKNIAGANDVTYSRPATTDPGRYFYKLAVSQRENSNVSGCSILSNIVAVGVNKYPVINATSSGYCTQDSLFLNANDGATFAWNGPSNFNSNQQNPYIPDAAIVNNGIYYVKGTSSKGCISLDSTAVLLTSRPTINAGNDQEICAGNSVQLQSIGSNNITSYQWTPVTGLSSTVISNPIASPMTSTNYILKVLNNQCAASDSVSIVVNENPSSDAGPDKVIIKGQSTTLNGMAAGTDVTYLWTPDVNITGANSLSPEVNPTSSQEYTLNVYSNKGCVTAKDNVLVKVYEQLFVPDAFTPNGDGINDTWVIETLEAYAGADVKVYNRYGQKIFDNNGKSIWWDGTFKGNPLSSGAYVYVIDLKNNTPVQKGVVYLIR
ncbi:MAG TPA: gliding motility-associated C-terminal domain-containing protein [Hanamia sp.]